MKLILINVFVLIVFKMASAQTKDETAVIERSKLLHKTVFGTKDSLTLEELFAKSCSYGHSAGNVQNRQEAIRTIIQSKAIYTDTSMKSYSVTMYDDDVAIVRYSFRETDTKDGKASPLSLAVMLVWVEEKGKWKLFGRQAVKLQ